MRITDFGPEKPSIQPTNGGYYIPFGLTQVERAIPGSDSTELSWQGYPLHVRSLSEPDLDAAIATLPEGDYSADKEEAFSERVRIIRRSQYPPIEDYVDGIVKGDNEQVAAYIAKCNEVKQRLPLPSQSQA